MTGSDCDFGTWAGFGAANLDVACAKLAALAEGAALCEFGVESQRVR